MDGLRLTGLDGLDAVQQARAREIFETGFDPALRSPFDDVRRDRCLVLLDDHDAVLGLTVTRDLADGGSTFLRYFVVEGRGRGTGTALWHLLRAALSGRERLLLDVEDPDEPGIADAERDLRWRRVRFYERVGVAMLPVLGYAPAHGGEATPLRLMLADLRLPAGEATPVPDAARLRELVVVVFRDRYRTASTDPAVDAALRASGLGEAHP